jgi:hypothetical protein
MQDGAASGQVRFVEPGDVIELALAVAEHSPGRCSSATAESPTPATSRSTTSASVSAGGRLSAEREARARSEARRVAVPTMCLGTYGHVIAELRDAPRISAPSRLSARDGAMCAERALALAKNGCAIDLRYEKSNPVAPAHGSDPHVSALSVTR